LATEEPRLPGHAGHAGHAGQAALAASRNEDYPTMLSEDDRGAWDAASRETDAPRRPMLWPEQQQLLLVNPIELLPSGSFYQSAALSKVRLAVG